MSKIMKTIRKINPLYVILIAGMLLLVSLPFLIPRDLELKNKSLKITDQDGKVRIWLGVNADGHPNLYMFDESGSLRILMSVYDRYNSVFAMRDTAGQYRIMINLDLDDPKVSLLDKEGRDRLTLFIDRHGNPKIKTFDIQGKSHTLPIR